MKESKKETRAGYRRGTKRVCIKITEAQHQFLKQQAKSIGKNGMSAVVRTMIDRALNEQIGDIK